MKLRLSSYAIGAAMVLAVAQCPSYADGPPPSGDYVSRQDYDKVLQRLDKVESELATIKQDAVQEQKDHDQEAEEFAAQIKVAVEQAEESHTGDTKFTINGDFTAGFTAQRHTNTAFGAGSGAGSGVDFSPLLLWEFNKQLFFEGGIDFNSADGASLSFADLSYIINDYVTIGAGEFPVAFGQYHNHFDPPWVNKLPDDPMVFGGGSSSQQLAPVTAVGMYLSGAVPIKTAKFNYNVYVVNGPRVISDDVNHLGDLDFDVNSAGVDNNNNKTVGGRVGFLPVPELEVGYSLMCGEAADNTYPDHVHAFLQAVDMNYTKQIEQINGTFSARAEYIWSMVGKTTYAGTDVNTGLPFGPTTFNDDRNGGYLTLAYRPTMVSNKILRNFEFVVRYDRVFIPSGAPAGGREQRYALGLDYWLDPRAVIKTAYEFDDANPGPGSDKFMVQFGLGF